MFITPDLVFGHVFFVPFHNILTIGMIIKDISIWLSDADQMESGLPHDEEVTLIGNFELSHFHALLLTHVPYEGKYFPLFSIPLEAVSLVENTTKSNCLCEGENKKFVSFIPFI